MTQDRETVLSYVADPISFYTSVNLYLDVNLPKLKLNKLHGFGDDTHGSKYYRTSAKGTLLLK
jgi:hypothetical protein